MQVSVRDNNVDQALRALKNKLQYEGDSPCSQRSEGVAFLSPTLPGDTPQAPQ